MGRECEVCGRPVGFAGEMCIVCGYTDLGSDDPDADEWDADDEDDDDDHWDADDDGDDDDDDADDPDAW